MGGVERDRSEPSAADCAGSCRARARAAHRGTPSAPRPRHRWWSRNSRSTSRTSLARCSRYRRSISVGTRTTFPHTGGAKRSSPPPLVCSVRAMATGDDLRGLMRLWPHGVSILSVDVDGDRMGVTVSSLVSLSLEPPLVGVSIGKEASCYELLRARGPLRDQPPRLGAGGARAPLRRRLPADRPLGGRPHARGQVAPLIDGALGWIEAETRAEADAGDHTFFIADVLSIEHGPSRTRARLPREHVPQRVIEAVVFDLDGVLLQSEEVWDAVRERYVRERGGRYDEEVQRAMMGMSAPEWSRVPRTRTPAFRTTPEQINADVVGRMLEAYRRELPLLPGAVEVVRRAAAARSRSRSRRRRTARSSRRCSGSPASPTCFARDGLVGGGRARQAGARRLPRGRAPARRRARALRGGRGLARRHPLGASGRDARHRDPERELSARRRGARARRPSSARSTISPSLLRLSLTPSPRASKARRFPARSPGRSPRGTS